MSKGNIVIFSNPDSDLVLQRSKIPAENGYNVYFFSWFHPKTDRISKCDWIQKLLVPPKLSHGGRFFSAAYLYWKYITLQPCIVHIHYALMNWRISKLISRLHPLIVTTMGSDIMPEAGGIKDDLVEPTASLLNNADIVTSKSQYMDETIRKLAPNVKTIHRITWGLDPEIFRPDVYCTELRNRLSIPDDHMVFFCARRCVPLANKDIVLKAFSEFLQFSRGKATLIVSQHLGKVEIAKGLEEQTYRLGIYENVRFVGAIPYERMPIYYNLSDAVVSVPNSDGMPQTIYEAIACGCYPIISDIPHTSELAKIGISLAEVEVKSIASLVEGMLWVIRNRGAIKQITFDNREIILPFIDKCTQSKRMNSIYDQLISKAFLYKYKLFL